MENKLVHPTQGADAGYVRERDLTLFEDRTVANLPTGRLLALCFTPGGEPIRGYTAGNGEKLLVHRGYSVDGWYFAYKNGAFGFVNPIYITGA